MYLTQILEVDLNWLSEGWEERLQDEDLDWEGESSHLLVDCFLFCLVILLHISTRI